ncbi:cytochrome c oxidase subunit 3 [Marinobacterium jannaschii]|uniref:cytochrome c oxidase subunit 3 n=1 Tax=Marinobacterium jannaschii TaxID=64970 RepID=UPI000482F3CF|nr:cytochrome c oxidase subunit 3 [Marinobacterium jannaschii]
MRSQELWRAEPGEGGESGWVPATERPGRIANTAIWLLLAVISVLFLLFLVAFISRAQLDDWPSLTGFGAPLADFRPLWLNSLLLLAASLALVDARRALAGANRQRLMLGILLAGAFALLFLIGQLRLWQLFEATGYALDANPASSFFYLLTGLHGLHLMGGLLVWGFLLGQLLALDQQQLPGHHFASSLQLCARYWHFLLLIWLLLFLVLTRTPETFRAIAAFCGLG